MFVRQLHLCCNPCTPRCHATKILHWTAIKPQLDYKAVFLMRSILTQGNILIWALTSVDNETSYELAIDLEDWSDNRRFARYRSFRLGSELDAFRLYHQVPN